MTSEVLLTDPSGRTEQLPLADALAALDRIGRDDPAAPARCTVEPVSGLLVRWAQDFTDSRPPPSMDQPTP